MKRLLSIAVIGMLAMAGCSHQNTAAQAPPPPPPASVQNLPKNAQAGIMAGVPTADRSKVQVKTGQ